MLVDRLDRRMLLLLSSVFRLAALLLLVLFIREGVLGLWLVFSAAFIMSVLARLFSAAHFALIPSLVREGDLQSANSVASFTMNAAYAGGMFLSSVIIAALGGESAIGLCIVLFAAGSVLTLVLPATPAVSSSGGASALSSVMAGLRSAIDIVRATPQIVMYMTLAGVASLVCGTIGLLPVYIQTTLGETVVQYGLIEGLSVVGAVLSSLILARVVVPRPRLMMQVSAATIAGAVMCFGLVPSVTVIVGARIMVAFALGVFNILYVTEFHRLLSSEYWGRVFSLSYVVSTVPNMLSTAAAGTAAEFIPTWVVWMGGGCIGLVGVGCVWLFNRAHREALIPAPTRKGL